MHIRNSHIFWGKIVFINKYLKQLQSFLNGYLSPKFFSKHTFVNYFYSIYACMSCQMPMSLSVTVGHTHWTTQPLELELEVFVNFLMAGKWTQDLCKSSIALNQYI